MRRKIKLSVSVILCSLFLTLDVASGDNKMRHDYLYERKEYQTTTVAIPSQTHKLGGLFGGYSNISIFPVPQNNAVGTNSMGKGINIISFPKGKIGYDKYFCNVDDIEGSGKYLSPISSDLIGFGQVRVFYLFDFKQKIHREYHIVFPFSKYIESIAIADARQRRFIFEIESQKENPKGPWDVNYSLQLVELKGDKPNLIKEISKVRSTWATTKDRVILWAFDEKKLQVLDMNLQPAPHPIENVVKQHKDKLDFSRIYIHPFYPFAVLTGGDNGSTIISWAKDRDTAPHLFISDATKFRFSPDGKWVVFNDYFGSGLNQTYVIPISDKYPHYLGSPILLSNKSFETGFGAWTTNPTGYVGTRLDEIYHWDLENRDFPDKGKMSFHAYIVQEDLKKLAREKRQGLGQ